MIAIKVQQNPSCPTTDGVLSLPEDILSPDRMCHDPTFRNEQCESLKQQSPKKTIEPLGGLLLPISQDQKIEKCTYRLGFFFKSMSSVSAERVVL